MAFDEVEFPVDVALGARGTTRFSTSIIEVDGGAEERIARWNGARREYDVGTGIQSRQRLYDVYSFFVARTGPANGFRFLDRLDHTSAGDGIGATTPRDVTIGTGDGTATQFQLVKKYASGSVTRTRNITKPVGGSVVISFDDATQAASGYTVDTTTGIVTFTVAPVAAVVVKAGFEYRVPVRFIDDSMEHSLEDRALGSARFPLIEIRDDGEIQDEADPGGAAFTTITAHLTLAISDGFARTIRTVTASLQVILPSVTNLNLGGPYHYVQNDSTSTQSFTLRKTVGGVTVATLAAGEDCVVFLGLDSGAAKKWYALG